MTDDKTARPHPSGFEVVTPRGVQEDESGRKGFAARLPLAAHGKDLPEVAEHVRTFRRAMASLAHFGRAHWTLDRVLSWITYRDLWNLDTPRLRGIKYPTMLGIPKVIEPAASSILLQALQRWNDPLVCRTGGAEIHGSVWGDIEYFSNPKLWPQGLLAREDVLREWPKISSVVELEPVPILAERQVVLSTVLPGREGIEVKAAPTRRVSAIADLAMLKKAISLRPVKAELDRDEWHTEIERRLQELDFGKKADRAATRALHADPSVYPGRPGKGPHKSAGSRGRK